MENPVVLQYCKVGFAKFDSGTCGGTYHMANRENASIVSLYDAMTWIGERSRPENWTVVKPVKG